MSYESTVSYPIMRRVWQTTGGGEESPDREISDRFNRPSRKGRGAYHMPRETSGVREILDASSTQMLGKILYDLRGFLHDPVNHFLDREQLVYSLRAFAAGHQCMLRVTFIDRLYCRYLTLV